VCDHGAVVDHRDGDDERVGGAASAALPHQIRIELQYRPDALCIDASIEWAELVAFASAHCSAASGDF
jgi:hypothetical protein